MEIRNTINQKQLALLIDADNAQASILDAILNEVAKYGDITVRRIYGDFTSPQSSSWKKYLNQRTIKPIQQFAYTTGKNSTDCSLIIDAMDLLHSGRFDGFCLVTSDSDFTSLAVRIREQGLFVYGIGNKQTPEAFRNACHKFIITEILVAPEATAGVGTGTQSPVQVAESSVMAQLAPEALDVMGRALSQTSDDAGWAQLGTLGAQIGRLKPDFDSRTYGQKKLSDLVRANPQHFEVEMRQKDLYVRFKAGAK